MLKEYIRHTYIAYDTTPIQHKLALFDTNMQHLEIYCRTRLQNTQRVNVLLTSGHQHQPELVANLEASVAREISDCAAAIQAFAQATDLLLFKIYEFMAERGMPRIPAALQETLQQQSALLLSRLHAVAVQPRIVFITRGISDRTSEAVRRTLAEVAVEVPAWAHEISMLRSEPGKKRKRETDESDTGRVSSRIVQTNED